MQWLGSPWQVPLSRSDAGKHARVGASAWSLGGSRVCVGRRGICLWRIKGAGAHLVEADDDVKPTGEPLRAACLLFAHGARQLGWTGWSMRVVARG